jgi:putative nucleotidyltransferase with HDIG domain
MLERACSVRGLLDSPGLKKLISGIVRLPSLPSIYLELSLALGSEDSSVKQVANIICQDMAMTAKVLQLVNSALFGISRNITSVAGAVTYLGMETVKSLTLNVMAFSQFRHPPLARFAEQLSAHSLQVGALARGIALSSQFTGATADECLTAGLLHDIGKLVLSDNRPAEFQDALEVARLTGVTHAAAESQIFGATHAEIGAYLLWLWGLPASVTEAVALHHNLGRSPGGAILAVHAADALVHNQTRPEFDVESLTHAGMMEQLPRWQQLCSESSLAATT